MPNSAELQRPLIQQLLRRQQASDSAAELLETHISWVLLCGELAYKIKKPIDLGFLDYSTLERRRHFCLEELRLNRRTAPSLYLDVVPITGTPDTPEFGGDGPVLDYAVKMRRFDGAQQLDRLLQANRLPVATIDNLAQEVAAFHADAERVAADSVYGTPVEVHKPVRENFSQIVPRVADTAMRQRLAALAAWAEAHFEQLQETLQHRRAAGFIRACHGDLHLGNIVLLDGRPTPFDGIEFSEALRWIDVISDTAFLVMDLQARGRPELAWRFLNGYLESNGDYAGLRLLRYYLSYRAMVRAKVAAIRERQAADDAREHARQQQALDGYVTLAESYMAPPAPFLLITCGPSGSGKSHHGVRLVQECGMIRLRSDVERKRLFGLAPTADSASTVDGGIYTADAGRQTYERLATLAADLLQAGLPVLVDATFLRRSQRDRFRQLAGELGMPFLILEFQAATAELRRRVRQRRAHGDDASEAGPEVLERQLAAMELPTPDERPYTLSVDTDRPLLAALAEMVRAHLRQNTDAP